MSEPDGIQNALDDMEFEVIDNGALELPTSVPALFSFKTEAELNPDGFEDAIEEYDFTNLDTFTTKNDSGFYYKTKVLTDHYKDCVVKVWAEDVRIFPKDNELDTYELSRIVHAIEDAFGAELVNVPREDVD